MGLRQLLTLLLCATVPVVPAWAQADVQRFSGQAGAAALRCPSDRSPTLSRAPVRMTGGGLDIGADISADTSTGTSTGTSSDKRADGPGAVADPLLPTPQPRTFRMAVWGDSHTASASFVEAVVQAYGLQRDRSLPSFIPPTFGMPGVRLPVHKACVGGGWQLRVAHRASPASAAFGKALVALSADSADGADSYLWIDFRAPRPDTRLRALDVHFSRDHADRTLVLGVSVDDGPERVVVPNVRTGSTANPAGMGRALRLQAAPALATVRIRLIAGQINLEGLVPVYDTAPAAVVDVFSVPGATANGWRAVDTQRLQDQAPQAYDLVLFQYGTNEAMADTFEPAAYARELRANLAPFIKLNPGARCILIGPPDRGAVVAATDRRTPAPKAPALRLALVHSEIGEIQQRVGREVGCAFWNWQAAMGGPGAAARWLAREPSLMQADLVHLSPKGYALSGQLFAQAFPLRPGRERLLR